MTPFASSRYKEAPHHLVTGPDIKTELLALRSYRKLLSAAGDCFVKCGECTAPNHPTLCGHDGLL